MYAGHYAAGLAIKANQPQAPTWALLLGVGFLDVLFGIFVMLGIERVTVTPGSVRDSRSTLSIGRTRSRCRSCGQCYFPVSFGGAGERLLWPSGLPSSRTFCWTGRCIPTIWRCGRTRSIHIGLGLWQLLPVGWWWVELAFIAAGCTYYVVRARRLGTFGGHALWACAVVVLLHVVNSPWLAVAK